jgi:hypothetical protein
MKSYYEPSISAYILLNEVSKSLKINEAPEISVQNGNAKKIIRKCNQIIERQYHETKMREILKYYIAHSFFEDYSLETDEDYSDFLFN